jgi:Iron-containing redox enzyme
VRSELALPFNEPGAPIAPTPLRLRSRDAFYHLVNVEEHPEVLPLAYDLVMQRLANGGAPSELGQRIAPFARESDGSLPSLLECLTEWRGRYSRPWQQPSEDLTRRQVLHYFVQYMPTAFVDGCWLQRGLRVATAHTPLGSSLTALYAHQVRAYVEDPVRHFVADYRAAYERLGAPVEEVSSHSFAERPDFLEHTFELPIFLLSIAQFTEHFAPEIVGLNLAWQFLDLSAFGPALIRDVCRAYGLPLLAEDQGQSEHLDKAREMARAAVVDFLEAESAAGRPDEAWKGVVRGVGAGVEAWNEWFTLTKEAAPSGPPDPRQEMLDLLWRKAPHATGYHANKMLGARKIDDHLAAFDGPALLEELARSRWIKPGRPDRSAMLRHLVKFGGPMLGVFSPVELGIIESWIDSLPPRDALGSPAAEPQPSTPTAANGPTVRQEAFVTGRGWTASDFRKRSEQLYGSCTTRELFYYLINVERYPDILPIAEKYARDRLERSVAMLWKGERPIPSRRYDPVALEKWVHKKHRDQVDSYRPPDVRPEAPKDAFIEVSVQLAPIILIDGGWLQGIASPALIHTVVGRMLFHVLVEEIGAGNAKEHHANIYRDLLAAMGEAAPPVESWEFARWPRLKDSSFDVPTLWLSMSCFPRHFLPEILGLNLAVELAGIGGPYMEARDTLRRFGYPTLFVDVHNAADNVAAGHSAWAMNTIKRYMDEVAEREGPHSVDPAWHRVWSGVRATLPQIGRLRLMTHRIGRRLFGELQAPVPLIFPS